MKTLLHTLHSAYLIDWLGEGLEYADEITVKEEGRKGQSLSKLPTPAFNWNWETASK